MNRKDQERLLSVIKITWASVAIRTLPSGANLICCRRARSSSHKDCESGRGGGIDPELVSRRKHAFTTSHTAYGKKSHYLMEGLGIAVAASTLLVAFRRRRLLHRLLPKRKARNVTRSDQG